MSQQMQIPKCERDEVLLAKHPVTSELQALRAVADDRMELDASLGLLRRNVSSEVSSLMELRQELNE